MSVRSNRRQEEAEEEGEWELTLVAITYTGDRSVYSAQGIRSEGGYPSLDSFHPGDTKLVRVPSGKLGWWETHADFEVSYDPETFAKALLEKNYIPEQFVGPGYDQGVRDELSEHLGLEPFSGEEELRQQLREIVGEDADEPAPDEGPDSRAEKLVSEYSRSDLIKVASSYDGIDAALEEHEVDSPSHLKSTGLAEFLAGQDDDEVNKRLATAEQGGDL